MTELTGYERALADIRAIVLKPVAPEEPPPAPRSKYPASRCGTNAGYMAHLRRRETPCEACLDMRRRYQQAYYAAHAEQRRRARSQPTPRPPTGCGTTAGYQAHRARLEEPCEACREANRAYGRAYRARNKKTSPRQRAACGTSAGYQAHYRRGETPCAACREARRKYQRGLYLKAARARWRAAA